jgi:hypothetical protein
MILIYSAKEKTMPMADSKELSVHQESPAEDVNMFNYATGS